MNKNRLRVGILGIYSLATLIMVLLIGVCKSPMAMKCPHMERWIAISMGLMALGSLICLFIKNKYSYVIISGLGIIAFIMNFISASVWVCKNPDMICRTTTSPTMKIMAVAGFIYSVYMIIISIKELNNGKDVFNYGKK